MQEIIVLFWIFKQVCGVAWVLEKKMMHYLWTPRRMSYVLVVDVTEVEGKFHGPFYLHTDNFRLDPEPQAGSGFHRRELLGIGLEETQYGMILLFQMVCNRE